MQADRIFADHRRVPIAGNTHRAKGETGSPSAGNDPRAGAFPSCMASTVANMANRSARSHRSGLVVLCL
jgi:hypothetical protein